MTELALPGFEDHEPAPIRKGAPGYLTMLSQISYPDGWQFWSLTVAQYKPIQQARRLWPAKDVDTVWIIREGEIRCALVQLSTGRVLSMYSVNGRV